MPTQAEINALHQSLVDKAAIIQTKAQLASECAADRQVAKEAKEMRKAEISAPIVADRVTYTNREVRSWAIMEATADDVTHQTALQDEYDAHAAQNLNENDAELNRNLYRADELLLLYYANNP